MGRDASYGAAWNNWGFVREAAGDLEGAEQVTAQSPPTAAPPLLLLLRPATTVFATGTNASTTEPLAIEPLVAHPRSLLANFCLLSLSHSALFIVIIVAQCYREAVALNPTRHYTAHNNLAKLLHVHGDALRAAAKARLAAGPGAGGSAAGQGAAAGGGADDGWADGWDDGWDDGWGQGWDGGSGAKAWDFGAGDSGHYHADGSFHAGSHHDHDHSHDHDEGGDEVGGIGVGSRPPPCIIFPFS